MPARERESIRFRTHSFLRSTLSPPRLSFPCPQPRWVPRRPRAGRFFPQSSQSTFSSLSTSRRNKCAPTRIFKKAVSYPRSARLHRHHLRHLRLPTLARATASPPNTAVSRHRRAFSSSFFPASSPVPFLSSHTYVSFIPSAEPRLPSKSLHALPSLFSLFSLSLRPPFSRFFLLFFSRKWLTPPFTFLPPLPLICVISCFLYFSSDSTLYMHVWRRMRECGEQTR